MAGNNDRVHGYNPRYQANPGVAPNFASFTLGNGGRPGQFINRIVARSDGLPTVNNDHQGHVIPQGLMNIVLDPLMIAMNAACNSAVEVGNYIAAHAPWLAPALAYGNALHIPMFDFDTHLTVPNTLQNAEDRLGGLFSIVTWNPVNICRAPDDATRNGQPGHAIDNAVLAYLQAHPAGVNAGWLAAAGALNAAGAAAGAPAVTAYLTAHTATLAAQLVAAQGYYAFNWHTLGLVPG